MSARRARSGGMPMSNTWRRYKQVLAEVAALHRLPEVAVRGRDNADVRLQRPRASDPLELALLQDAQDLCLRRPAHLAHFVEEQHAAGGQLDVTGLGLMSAREGATFVSEHFRLEQLLGQGRAIQGHERPVPPRGRGMDEARHDLLAGPGLAGDQDGGVGGGDLRGLAQHLAPLRGLADDSQAGLHSLEAARHDRAHAVHALRLRRMDRSSEVSARCAEAEVVRDPARERHLRAIERQGPLRPERKADQRLRRARSTRRGRSGTRRRPAPPRGARPRARRAVPPPDRR